MVVPSAGKELLDEKNLKLLLKYDLMIAGYDPF